MDERASVVEAAKQIALQISLRKKAAVTTNQPLPAARSSPLSAAGAIFLGYVGEWNFVQSLPLGGAPSVLAFKLPSGDELSKAPQRTGDGGNIDTSDALNAPADVVFHGDRRALAYAEKFRFKESVSFPGNTATQSNQFPTVIETALNGVQIAEVVIPQEIMSQKGHILVLPALHDAIRKRTGAGVIPRRSHSSSEMLTLVVTADGKNEVQQGLSLLDAVMHHPVLTLRVPVCYEHVPQSTVSLFSWPARVVGDEGTNLKLISENAGDALITHTVEPFRAKEPPGVKTSPVVPSDVAAWTKGADLVFHIAHPDASMRQKALCGLVDTVYALRYSWLCLIETSMRQFANELKVQLALNQPMWLNPYAPLGPYGLTPKSLFAGGDFREQESTEGYDGPPFQESSQHNYFGPPPIY